MQEYMQVYIYFICLEPLYRQYSKINLISQILQCGKRFLSILQRNGRQTKIADDILKERLSVRRLVSIASEF